MNLETFFDKFDLFADAPNAVAKMRELILRLAMQGKLVCQSPRDEPADGLVLELKAEVSDKNGRRTVPLPPIAPDEIPFKLPAGWVWERLGNIGETNVGLTYSPQDVSDVGTPVLRSSNVQNGKLDFDDLVRVTCEPKQSVMVQDGDLLICARNGSRALVGKVALIENLNEPAAFGAFMAIFRSRVNMFLYHFICSPLFRRMIDEVNTTTINQITQSNLRSTLAPIPPLAEQKRIVAKVDELMKLCDRLEAQQQEREEKHKALSRASLARFADAPTPANLQFIFHPSFTIAPADLRKSILTLAVQGKLVPQDPNDEPAEKFLSKIEAQKKRLSGSGELKADKKAWLNSSINPPHEIPRSWCWVRLQDVFEISRGGSPRPAGDPRFFGGSIPWITVGEVTKDSGMYLTETTTGLTEEGAERSRFINPGDLLLTNSGATLGVPKISKIRGCMNDGVAVLRQFHSFDLNDFGYLYLTQQTPALRDVNQGMGQPNLNTPIIAGWFFPVPPLAEQRRIVAKVEELMKLVDALETQLAASRATAANLLAALVAELTGTPNTAKASVPTNTTTGTGRRGRPPKS